MFSGIIQSLGTVEKITRGDEKAEMVIRTESGFSDFELGESIAVNGVCLTVRESGDHYFVADLSTETLNRTGFKEVKERTKVNLERSLTPSQKISGHFVSGHVDQVATVVELESKSGEILFRFEYPPELAPFIIEKGSIAIDGISLTLVNVQDDISDTDHMGSCDCHIIPHTKAHTSLGFKNEGDRVNLEFDILGKYAARQQFLSKN